MIADGEVTAGSAPERTAVVAGATDVGRRRENQDNFLISDLSLGADGGVVLRPATGAAADRVTASFELGGRGALLIVADGMGGAAAGRLASGLACSFILAELQAGWGLDAAADADTFGEQLVEAVEKANYRIHEHARRNPECTGMGTTATVVGVLGSRLLIAQVGDSRAYLVRGASATQLTRDQSLIQQLLDAGAMTVEEAERSEHGSVILQALGVEPGVNVDLVRQDLQPDDLVLLCSDGLYRVVQDTELAPLAQSLPEPAALCDALIALAKARDTPDNVTVIAARVRGRDAAAHVEHG
jgi:PPM family protein phosphatase